MIKSLHFIILTSAILLTPLVSAQEFQNQIQLNNSVRLTQPVILSQGELTTLTDKQIELENDIIRFDISWNYLKNQEKIESFDKRYTEQLRTVNCYREIPADYPDCLDNNILDELENDAGPIQYYQIRQDLINGQAKFKFEAANSNSQRIRERIRNLRQNNFSILAIEAAIIAAGASILATLVTFIAEFSKLLKAISAIKNSSVSALNRLGTPIATLLDKAKEQT